MCSIESKGDSKVFKWKILPEALNKLYPLLYLPKEHAGKFKLRLSDKTTTNEATVIKGKADSVSAPMSTINYHTHPVNCYVTEKTVYGWPSGEDLRESILFSMRGCICHVVIAVEGVYVIQVNPCIVNNLIHLENFIDQEKVASLKEIGGIDIIRGLIITCIEVYFRSTHAFRGHAFNKNHNVDPEDFVKLSNAFQLGNMFNSKAVKGCSKLKCNNVSVFEAGKYKTVSFEKYCKDYEHDTYVFEIDKNGKIKYSDVLLSEAISHGMLSLVSELILGKNCNFPQYTMKENWFLLSLTPNVVNNIPYTSLSTAEKWKFLEGEHVSGDISLMNNAIPVFYYFNMSGNCDFNNIKNDLHDKEYVRDRRVSTYGYGSRGKVGKSRVAKGNRGKTSKGLILFGSPSCPHCGIKVDKYDKMGVKVDVRYFPTIREAVNAANKYAKKMFNIKKLLSSIPAVFDSKGIID